MLKYILRYVKICFATVDSATQYKKEKLCSNKGTHFFKTKLIN